MIFLQALLLDYGTTQWQVAKVYSAVIAILVFSYFTRKNNLK